MGSETEITMEIIYEKLLPELTNEFPKYGDGEKIILKTTLFSASMVINGYELLIKDHMESMKKISKHTITTLENFSGLDQENMIAKTMLITDDINTVINIRQTDIIEEDKIPNIIKKRPIYIEFYESDHKLADEYLSSVFATIDAVI